MFALPATWKPHAMPDDDAIRRIRDQAIAARAALMHAENPGPKHLAGMRKHLLAVIEHADAILGEDSISPE